MMTDRQIVQYFAEAVTAGLWLWVAGRHSFGTRPLPRILRMPGRIFRICLVLATLGLLAGCSSSDPLAQASGPLFSLNVGHWQPTPQDLVAPPKVTDQ